MQKLKHGDRVTCEIDGTKIDDARISVDRDGDYFICQNEKDGLSISDVGNTFGYKYSWIFDPEDPEDDDVTNLTVIPRTLDDLIVGDEVKNTFIHGQEAVYGSRCKKSTVLARVENLVALSDWDRPNAYLCHKTIQQLKEEGYTLVQPIEEPIEELTMEEVCKRLGKQVKIKK